MQQTGIGGMQAFLGWPELIIILILMGAMVAVVAVIILVATSRKKSSPVPPPIAPPARDLEQELRTLAKLKDQGLINDEEFKLKKKVLLGI